MIVMINYCEQLADCRAIIWLAFLCGYIFNIYYFPRCIGAAYMYRFMLVFFSLLISLLRPARQRVYSCETLELCLRRVVHSLKRNFNLSNRFQRYTTIILINRSLVSAVLTNLIPMIYLNIDSLGSWCLRPTGSGKGNRAELYGNSAHASLRSRNRHSAVCLHVYPRQTGTHAPNGLVRFLK